MGHDIWSAKSLRMIPSNILDEKKSMWTARGRTWGSPPYSGRTLSMKLTAPLSKYHYP